MRPRRCACHFFAGPENRLVEVAVRSVLRGPPNGYNPLVLYGPSGTGKSHIARGLAAVWKARNRRHRVVCTTAVDFARELADAIETPGGRGVPRPSIARPTCWCSKTSACWPRGSRAN